MSETLRSLTKTISGIKEEQPYLFPELMNIVIITTFQLSDVMSERSVYIPGIFFSDHICLFFNWVLGIYQVPTRSILGLVKECIL